VASLIALVAMVAWAVASYATGGFVALLVAGSSAQGDWLQRVRDVVAGWGPLAPVIFTLVVVVEVVVAPIPGPLLYAPAGAIFGGFLGGTLTLIGNVIGAAIACVLGAIIGERLLNKTDDRSNLGLYRERLKDRGLWVVMLLRANPFTSSDLVSYAAGIAGVPAWKVAVGTLVGMAPLCYFQAYFSQRIFEVIPGPLILLGAGVFIAGIVVLLLVRFGRVRQADQ